MRRILTFAFLLVSLMGSQSALAAARVSTSPNQKYRAGLALGLGVPTANNYGGTRALLGIDFYAAIDERLDLGVSYTTGGSYRDERFSRHRYRMNFGGVEANFKLPSVGPGFYLGASAGLASVDGGDAFLPGIDDIYIGPKVGITHHLLKDLSLGFESKLLFVSSSPFVGWIEFLANLHYHF